MVYNITKENEQKTSNVKSVPVENEDTLLLTKMEMSAEEPEHEENLGEEFLVPGINNEVEDSESEEEGSESEAEGSDDEDPFLEEQRVESVPVKSYETIQQEKSKFLYQLKRFENKGIPVRRRFSMEHSLEEIRGEYLRIKKELDIDSSINYCRQGLMFCVSTIEMANGRYNIGGKLDGWSQSIMSNIDSYDEVFEELYEKYYSTMKMSPEVKLMSMIAGSAFMIHLQNSFATKSDLPPRQRDMEGPQIDTDELLKELNEENISNISDEPEIIEIEEEKTKKIDIKRRGRPPKAKK